MHSPRQYGLTSINVSSEFDGVQTIEETNKKTHARVNTHLVCNWVSVPNFPRMMTVMHCVLLFIAVMKWFLFSTPRSTPFPTQNVRAVDTKNYRQCRQFVTLKLDKWICIYEIGVCVATRIGCEWMAPCARYSLLFVTGWLWKNIQIQSRQSSLCAVGPSHAHRNADGNISELLHRSSQEAHHRQRLICAYLINMDTNWTDTSIMSGVRLLALHQKNPDRKHQYWLHTIALHSTFQCVCISCRCRRSARQTHASGFSSNEQCRLDRLPRRDLRARVRFTLNLAAHTFRYGVHTLCSCLFSFGLLLASCRIYHTYTYPPT